MASTTLGKLGNSSNKFLKAFMVAEGKVGKTTYIAASCLGILPGQTRALVTKPSYLHILGYDEAVVDGLADFITKICGKTDPSFLEVDVHPMTEIVRKAASAPEWDFSVYNATMLAIGEIKRKVRSNPGVHAMVFSSVSGLAAGLKAAIAAPPTEGKKSAGMDQAKWDAWGNQMHAIRNEAHEDIQHVFWEGHIFKRKRGEGQAAEEKDDNGIQGNPGKVWALNMGEVFRLRRESSKYPNTQIDKVFMETKPSLDFISGGRGFANLAPKEYNLVEVAEKLGKQIGGPAPATNG